MDMDIFQPIFIDTQWQALCLVLDKQKMKSKLIFYPFVNGL